MSDTGADILTSLQFIIVNGTGIRIMSGTGPEGAGLAVVNKNMPEICMVNENAGGITVIRPGLPIPLHPPMRFTNALPIGIEIIPVVGLNRKTVPVDIVGIIVDVAAGTDAEVVNNFDDANGYYHVILECLHTLFVPRIFMSAAKDGIKGAGSDVVIKVVRRQKSMFKSSQREASILKKLHEADPSADPSGKYHIIRLERTFEHQGHLCLVFKAMSVNLGEVVKRFANCRITTPTNGAISRDESVISFKDINTSPQQQNGAHPY
ncbi:hypothetical protein PCASD_03604 [Puccinia coronata f. sp. avenae]|uniref:Uncharacterized protein n=1 Tax=Puccinia coronata f. sp. avenae TaxID=200324 RepID=A0A2N5VDI4_9BASI|nr:hypothetical protein PCASD_03604 [Puccinia coronata f. sp. avenae]